MEYLFQLYPEQLDCKRTVKTRACNASSLGLRIMYSVGVLSTTVDAIDKWFPTISLQCDKSRTNGKRNQLASYTNH
jgi:hypothetical protein